MELHRANRLPHGPLLIDHVGFRNQLGGFSFTIVERYGYAEIDEDGVRDDNVKVVVCVTDSLKRLTEEFLVRACPLPRNLHNVAKVA